MKIPMITSPIPTNQNVIYRFRGKVALDTTDGITLHAFADSRYKLYRNTYIYKNGSRRHRQGVVLRYDRRRTQP